MNRRPDDEWPGETDWPGDAVWRSEPYPQGAGDQDEDRDADRQGGDRQPAPTHRIVRSPADTVADRVAQARDRQDPDSQDSDRQDEPDNQGLRVAVSEALEGLRFVNQSPGSLRDQIEYAIDGAYSNRVDGPWRNANIIYARLIAVPGLFLCYVIGWTFFTRLSRALTCGPLLLLLLVLLNAMPITAWLIPDWADFTSWLRG